MNALQLSPIALLSVGLVVLAGSSLVADNHKVDAKDCPDGTCAPRAAAEADCPTCMPPPAAKAQKTCPVLGGPVGRTRFVDVAGHRIYVCCPGCARKVKADPAKYIAVLRERGEGPEVLPAVATEQEPAVQLHKEATIDTAALAVLLRSDVPLVLLDARTGRYDDGRRIPGAKTLAAGASKKEIARLVPDKDTLIVTYCGSVTCPASKALADHLKKHGYKNVLEYPKGIKGWVEDGQPVKQPSEVQVKAETAVEAVAVADGAACTTVRIQAQK